MKVALGGVVAGLVLIGFAGVADAMMQDDGTASSWSADALPAVSLPTDGTWQGPFDEFNGGAGTFMAENYVINGPAVLRITDVYVVGDQYAIYDGGTAAANLIGTSSTPLAGGTDFDSDPQAAYTDPEYSHFTYNLGAGSHDIYIQEIAEPSGYADSTYSISAVVPEPSALALVAVSALGLGVIGRRRSRLVAV